MAKSTAYYHLGKGYDTQSRKIREIQKQAIKEKIAKRIDEGHTTGTIAREWNIPLHILNKIYTSR